MTIKSQNKIIGVTLVLFAMMGIGYYAIGSSKEEIKNSFLTVTGSHSETQPANEASAMIKQLFDASLTNAETFNTALQKFSQQSDQMKALVVSEMVKQYSALPPERYQDRWALVWLSSKMMLVNQPESLKFFQDILAKPISTSSVGETDTFSPYREEMTIDLAALDGLWRLARSGNHAARDSLLKAINHPEYAVRRMAVSRYLEQAPDKELAKKELLGILKPEERFFLEIKTIQAPPPLPPGVESKPANSNFTTAETRMKPPTIPEENLKEKENQ